MVRPIAAWNSSRSNSTGSPFNRSRHVGCRWPSGSSLPIAGENKESYMLSAGKSLLMHDEIETMEELYAKIRALTAEELQQVASESFINFSRLLFR